MYLQSNLRPIHNYVEVLLVELMNHKFNLNIES